MLAEHGKHTAGKKLDSQSPHPLGYIASVALSEYSGVEHADRGVHASTVHSVSNLWTGSRWESTDSESGKHKHICGRVRHHRTHSQHLKTKRKTLFPPKNQARSKYATKSRKSQTRTIGTHSSGVGEEGELHALLDVLLEHDEGAARAIVDKFGHHGSTAAHLPHFPEN